MDKLHRIGWLRVLLASGAALALSACDELRPTTAAADDAPRAQAAAVPPKPVADPSLPPAASVVEPAAAASAAQDDARKGPNRETPPAEQSTAMPKPNQANNHSSPALDPATSK